MRKEIFLKKRNLYIYKFYLNFTGKSLIPSQHSMRGEGSGRCLILRSVTLQLGLVAEGIHSEPKPGI